jgi:gas vesicle protein
MKDLHAQLDKVQRGDEKYLALLTEEYEIMKQEKQLQNDLSAVEELERTNFAVLSSAVRESHEKERTRTERTKYWSIGGSMLGALIGIIGASLNNYLRNRELRRIVHESAAGGHELRSMIAELASSTQKQHNDMEGFVKDMKSSVTSESNTISNVGTSDNSVKDIVTEIQRQDTMLQREMQDIRKLLIATKGADQLNEIVYVGPEMEGLLQSSEKNLELQIKNVAVLSTAFTCGTIAVAIPIIYWLFRGN